MWPVAHRLTALHLDVWIFLSFNTYHKLATVMLTCLFSSFDLVALVTNFQSYPLVVEKQTAVNMTGNEGI
jgi:hypothetical protein